MYNKKILGFVCVILGTAFFVVFQEEAPVENKGFNLPIYVVNDEPSADFMDSTSSAIIIADAPWSLNSIIVRKRIFETAYDQYQKGKKTVSFFVISEKFFPSFQEYLRDKNIESYSHESRERGAYIVIDRSGEPTVHDPDDFSGNVENVVEDVERLYQKLEEE